MRAAFLGTPAAAVPSLAALADVADVDLVVTRPDAARGRSKAPQPPPVKVAAKEFGYEVVQPSNRSDLERAFADRVAYAHPGLPMAGPAAADASAPSVNLPRNSPSTLRRVLKTRMTSSMLYSPRAKILASSRSAFGRWTRCATRSPIAW